MNKNEKIARDFSGFSVSLKSGSRRKQMLSNHLELRMDDERSGVNVKLTLRQAKALQKFLNDNLSA